MNNNYYWRVYRKLDRHTLGYGVVSIMGPRELFYNVYNGAWAFIPIRQEFIGLMVKK